MRNLIFLVFALSILACKTDKKQPETTTTVDGVTTIIATDPSQLDIPETCDMITTEDIKSILGVPAASINVKNADDKSNKGSRSCFFQWDDPSTPNAGIMLMIQTNPAYNDAQDFFTLSMKAKLETGEAVLGQDKPERFKKFDAGDGIGAYSFNQSRCYWNLGNDYMFMLAFNITTLSEKKMVDAAEKIAAKVNANFASKVKK